MPNLSKKKIIPIHSGWRYSLDSKSLLRLHDHGLLRVFKIKIDNKSKNFNRLTFFSSLIDSNFYQELFFDHFSQSSIGKHGPFLIKNIQPDHFSKKSNRFFKEDFLQIVTSPKWGCSAISENSLEKVKVLLQHVIQKTTLIYFLDKCRTFNTSSNEAKIFEHEWSHNLTSFYEFILYDPEINIAHIMILTYE